MLLIGLIVSWLWERHEQRLDLRDLQDHQQLPWWRRRLTPSPAPRHARIISGGRVLLASIAGSVVGWAFERARTAPDRQEQQ